MKNSTYIELSSGVRSALQSGKPVVAVETSFLSAGIPYPQNAQTAKGADNLIRSEGAEPAFIAVINGKVKVGLEASELEYIGRLEGKAEKISVRDLPAVVAKGGTGTVSVSAAVAVAEKAGIKILAAGAIDGVSQDDISDISPDVEALGGTDMMVVASGVKLFMDIPRTVEALEARGVSTVGVSTTRMPAFYCRESECSTDTYMDTADELAEAFKVKLDLGTKGAFLVCNPCPQNSAMAEGPAERACSVAVSKARENSVKGKDLTSFVLALAKEMTGGMSMDAHIALVLGNADLAAKVAAAAGSLIEPEESEEEAGTVSDEVFETLKCQLESEIEASVNQKMQGFGMYMNPYMNPYFAQNPQMGQMPQMPQMMNPYQAVPQMGQMPQMPMQAPAAPAPAPAPQPYVNPYKPERPAEPAPEPVPAAPVYKAVPDEEWVNPFAPKHDEPKEEAKETPAGGDAPVIARPAEEVMQMVEETVAEEAPAAEITEEKAEPAAEPAPEPAAEPVPAEEEKDDGTTLTEYVPPVHEKKNKKAKAKAEEAPAEEAPAAEAEAPAEETPAAEAPAAEPAPAEEKPDDNTLTEYVPPVHEKKQRKPENQEKPQQDEAGMTSYDPEFYKKRAAERKQRIAEAAGEAKHVEEAKAAEPDYIECKGPLEFTGEHPWAWKCTKCGQLFQKHEIPHKCVKTD